MENIKIWLPAILWSMFPIVMILVFDIDTTEAVVLIIAIWIGGFVYLTRNDPNPRL